MRASTKARTRSALQPGQPTATPVTPPPSRRRLSTGTPPGEVPAGLPPSVRPVAAKPQPSAAPAPPPGRVVSAASKRRDPATLAKARLAGSLGKVNRFLVDDAALPVPRLTQRERDALMEILRRGSSDPSLAQGFPELDQALKDISTLSKRPVVIPNDLDLDSGQEAVTSSDIRHFEDLRATAKGRNVSDLDMLVRINALVTQGKYRTADFLLHHLVDSGKAADIAQMAIGASGEWADVKLAAETATLVNKNTPERDQQLQAADLAARCVGQARLGQFDLVRDAVRDLYTSNLPIDVRDRILAGLVDQFLSRPDLWNDPGTSRDVGVSLLTAAEDLARRGAADVPKDFIASVRNVLADRFPPLAEAALQHHWWKEPLRFSDEALIELCRAVLPGRWKTDGLSAKVFNMLWRDRRYDVINQLIAMGADTNQAAIYPAGPSAINGEGVYSGYVQPLVHLLGNYVRRASLADPPPRILMPGEVGSSTDSRLRMETAKIDGARRILAALKGKGDVAVLTEYNEIKDTLVLRMQKAMPGTFWGFEHVRMPYVEAAHELPGGKTPLRMMELWEAVTQVLEADGYVGLFRDPANTIEKCIREAKISITSKEAGKPDDDQRRDSEEYFKQFEVQAREYLTFLSKGSVRARHETAELSGRNEQKVMGAMACKAGLWWALESEKRGNLQPIYYILDGLDINDVINYKSFKTKQINSVVDQRYPSEVERTYGPKEKPPQFDEVITLAEMREILKNWDELSSVVVFIEKGLPLTDLGRVQQWIKHMKKSDELAETRRSAPVGKFEKLLLQIAPDLVGSTDGAVVRKVVAAADSVRIAAGSPHPEVLVETLKEARILDMQKVLPPVFAETFEALLLATTAEHKAELAGQLKAGLAKIKPYLGDPLLRAVEKAEKG
jgi:hypothetical protein